MKRCSWVDEKSEVYIKYHDEEWGVPKYDDRDLFELLVLESFQAGLSWLTVLKKREAFKAAFDDFDVKKVANYGEDKINELLKNEKIIVEIVNLIDKIESFENDVDAYCAFMKDVILNTSGLN